MVCRVFSLHPIAARISFLNQFRKTFPSNCLCSVHIDADYGQNYLARYTTILYWQLTDQKASAHLSFVHTKASWAGLLTLKETVHLPNMWFYLRYQFHSFSCKKPYSEVRRFHGPMSLIAGQQEIFNFKYLNYWLTQFLLPHLEADSLAYPINLHLW